MQGVKYERGSVLHFPMKDGPHLAIDYGKGSVHKLQAHLQFSLCTRGASDLTTSAILASRGNETIGTKIRTHWIKVYPKPVE